MSGLGAGAQQSPAVCGPPPVARADARPNIFTEQQERWLGEAMADSLEGELTPVHDASLSTHLQSIADQLVSTLPSTSIKFHVMLIDASEVNGFSIAGGHIYITRKLAASARSDDELAGVIGHEMGHIASHQFAFEATRDLKRLLGVTSLGDRADVYAKYHALMDARLKDKHPIEDETDEKQDEADKISVYVTAAAGYRPVALAEFWDRVFFVNGKTRGRVADFFNITKPTEKRLRGLRALAAAMPAGCGGTRQTDRREFAQWHDAVVANQKTVRASESKALSEVALTPPLRMELDQVRFSPDGSSILAQDESSIFVLSREPFAVRYRIDADGALPANFSPDSRSVTFSTPGLHTEQWSVDGKKLIAAHELLSRNNCVETKLSPDGRSLLCVVLNPETGFLALSLMDTSTSEVIWENKTWVPANWGMYSTLLWAAMNGGSPHLVFSGYSADNNMLLMSSGSNNLGLDLRTRVPVKTGGEFGFKTTGEYAFVGSDRVAVVNPGDVTRSGIYSFPDGKMVQTVTIPPLALRSVTNPGENLHLLMFGAKEFGVALGDLNTSKYLLGVKVHSMDEYNGTVAAESDAGGVYLLRMGEADPSKQKTVELPVGPLAELRTAAASPDGRYIAVSTKYRGAVWDATTGKQLALVHGFSGASWTSDDTLYFDVDKQLNADRHMAEISMKARTMRALLYKVDDEMHMRYGLLTKWKQDEKTKMWTLTLYDPADAKVMWTKEFHDSHLGYAASYGDRDLLFSFGLKSNTAKDAMKADSRLMAEAAVVKNKENGRYIEVIDAKTGAEAGGIVLEVPPNFAGIHGVNRAGDLMYLTMQDDRTAVYSMASGKELRKLFGWVGALDPETGRVCTANRVGEAVVYDAEGVETAHYQLGEPIRYVTFREGAKVLMVLTADQKVRRLDVEGGREVAREPAR